MLHRLTFMTAGMPSRRSSFSLLMNMLSSTTTAYLPPPHGDYQKRISMSGNSVKSNSFCSLLKVVFVTSFFKFSLESLLLGFKFILTCLEFIFNLSILLIDFLKVRFSRLILFAKTFQLLFWSLFTRY